MSNVEHPEHYNAGGVEDLEKAKWYIDKLIERAKQ